ncbi:MAG: heme-binding protein [Pseudomonadota bacterium]
MTKWTRRSFIVAGLASAAPGATASEYKGYETPTWKVIDTDGVFQLREYAPFLAAEVTIKGSADTALRQGFQTLAKYIFGANDGKSKVAMTSPVTRMPAKIAMTSPVTRQRSGDAWTVRFMMPSEYTSDTLPKPQNDAIRIVTVDPGRRAVVRFAGLASETRIARAEAALRSWIDTKGMTATGTADAAWFDDPFTLPWKRRNEVSLAVEAS